MLPTPEPLRWTVQSRHVTTRTSSFRRPVVDDADADQKVATDVAWANDTVRQAALPVLHDAGLDNSASTAQEAAEWMNADGHMTTTLAAKLARAIYNAGAAFRGP